MWRAAVFAGLAFLFLATGPFAQEPVSPSRSGRRVIVDVLAFDTRGQAVGNLASGDFQVLDQGKPQHIVFFRSGEAESREFASLAPLEYSNRYPSALPHPTVILFDLVNTDRSWQEQGRQALVRALEPLESGRNLYLYVLGNDGTLYPIHSLPVAMEAEEPETPWTRRIDPLLDQAIRTAGGLVLRARRPTFSAFSVISKLSTEMTPIPGRKDIVWITHGLPVTGGESLCASLARQNVVVDTVDLGGPGISFTNRDMLERLATLTGGVAFSAVPADKAIAELIAGLRSAYRIEYDAASVDQKDEFRKVRVICSRKGVRIRTEVRDAPDPGQEQALLDAAAKNPLDVSEIGLRATVSPSDNSEVVRFQIRIDAQDVLLAQRENRYVGNLILLVDGYEAGEQAASSSAPALRRRPLVLSRLPIKIDLTDEQHAQAMKEGINVELNVAVGNNPENVRVIAFDRGSGALGSLIVPITVAKPGQKR